MRCEACPARDINQSPTNVFGGLQLNSEPSAVVLRELVQMLSVYSVVLHGKQIQRSSAAQLIVAP